MNQSNSLNNSHSLRLDFSRRYAGGAPEERTADRQPGNRGQDPDDQDPAPQLGSLHYLLQRGAEEVPEQRLMGTNIEAVKYSCRRWRCNMVIFMPQTFD